MDLALQEVFVDVDLLLEDQADEVVDELHMEAVAACSLQFLESTDVLHENLEGLSPRESVSSDLTKPEGRGAIALHSPVRVGAWEGVEPVQVRLVDVP
eukprot:3457930-Rhodomonas_salina.2